jgi:hypothetical protein
LWKVGTFERHVAMQRFVVKDRRNPQPRVLDQEFLHCIGEEGRCARVLTLPLPGNLPDPVLHDDPSLLEREVSAIFREIRLRFQLRPLRPEADQLRHLLIKRHPAEQISHATVDR